LVLYPAAGEVPTAHEAWGQYRNFFWLFSVLSIFVRIAKRLRLRRVGAMLMARRCCVNGAQVLCIWRGGAMSAAHIGYVGGAHLLCRGRTSVMCTALHGVFGVDTRHVRGSNMICWRLYTVWISFQMMCQGSLRGMFRVDTRYVRQRYTMCSRL